MGDQGRDRLEWMLSHWPPRVRKRAVEAGSRGGRTLLLRGDGPGWLVVNEAGLEAFRALGDGAALPVQTADKSGRAGFLASLHAHGLVSIEGLPPASTAPEDSDLPLELRVITVRVTHRCNLRCSYCYAAAGGPGHRFSRKAVMRSLQALLPHAAGKVNITLTGGEPLLAPDRLEKLISEIRLVAGRAGRDVRWVLQTNGTLLDDRRLSLILANDMEVGLSLDGPAEIHDSTRLTRNGRGTFARVVRNIRKLMKAGRPPTVLVTVRRGSVAAVPETLILLEQLGVGSVKLSHFTAAGRGRGARSDVLTGREAFEAYRKAMDLIETGAVRRLEFSNLVDFFAGVAIDRLWYVSVKAPCGAARNAVSIDCNGHVFPCEGVVDYPEFDLGPGDPAGPSVLSRPKAAEVRERSATNVPRCAKCLWRGYCGGVCSAAAYATSGSLRGAAPHICHFRRHVIEELMWRLAEGGPLREYCERHFGLERLGLA